MNTEPVVSCEYGVPLWASVVVLVLLVVPVLSSTLGGCLVAVLAVLNLLLLLPFLLLLLSPSLSLTVMTFLSQLVLAPFWRCLIFTAHLSPYEPPLVHGRHSASAAEAHHAGGGLFNLAGPDDDNNAGDAGVGGQRDGVAGWVRQAVFVLSVVLGGDVSQVGLGVSVVRFLVWWLGVRSFLSVLTVALVVMRGDSSSESGGPSLTDFATTTATTTRGAAGVPGAAGVSSGGANSPRAGAFADDLTRHSLPYYLGQLSVGVLSAAHCSQHTPGWDLVGLIVFSVCSDSRVQDSLKLQARKLQVDAAEGFEGEVVHGFLILLDLVVCALFFVRAVRREDYPVLVLSYSNGFIALMELRVRVWQKMQAGLRRMSELRRATRRELRAHNDVCAVCLGAMSAARVTHCRHLFHGKCLRQALRVSPQCPLCKVHVVRHNVYVIDPMAEVEG